MKRILKPLGLLFVFVEIALCVLLVHYLVPYALLTFKNTLVPNDSDSLLTTSILWLGLSIILSFIAISLLVLWNQKLENCRFYIFNGVLGSVIGLLIGAILFFFAPQIFSSEIWVFIFFTPMILGLNIGLRNNKTNVKT